MLLHPAGEFVDGNAAAKVVAIVQTPPRGPEKVARVAFVTRPDPRHWYRRGFNGNLVTEAERTGAPCPGAREAREVQSGARRYWTGRASWT